MSKRSLEMTRRRDRILDAARDLIADQGYETLTMRVLAQASGVTVPTIYNLIGNKEAVLGATIHEGTLRFWETAELSDDPLSIIERNISELLQQPLYFRPVLRVLLNGGASAEMAELVALFLKHLQVTIDSMEARGDLEPWVDSAILAERILSNLYGATSEWATGRLSDTALPLAAGYDACIALAGVTIGATQERFQKRARTYQKIEISSERKRMHERGLARVKSGKGARGA